MNRGWLKVMGNKNQFEMVGKYWMVNDWKKKKQGQIQGKLVSNQNDVEFRKTVFELAGFHLY